MRCMVVLGVLGLILVAACDRSSPDPVANERAAAPAAATVGSAPLPFSLPKFPSALARPLGAAPAFIAVQSADAVTVGKLAGGLRAKDALPTPLAQLGPALERVLGGMPASADPETPLVAHARLPIGNAPIDAIALIEPSLTVRTLVEVFVRVRQRAVAFAVQADTVARLPFVFGPRPEAAPQGRSMRLAVRADGIELYGTVIAWGRAEDELKQLIENNRQASSMTIVAALQLEPRLTTEQLVNVLQILAANGIPEIELALGPDEPVAAWQPSGGNSGVPSVSLGQPTVTGELDKAIVRRYLKRNINKIQYCYEKRLLERPSLTGGTLTTRFVITPNGTVQRTTGSGFDPDVATCVTEVLGGIEFPKPKGGGVVTVSVPFTFRSSGG